MKPTFLTRPLALFFLAVLICAGCGAPGVTPTKEIVGHPALPDPTAELTDEIPCPQPVPQPAPKPKIEQGSCINKARQSIIQTAVTAVGTPYRWGGLTPKGFDCSGLVVYAYKKIGTHVPRTAKAQFNSCKSITRQNLKPADLVFFSVPRRRGVVHVGIYIGKNQFVHAPGRGRKVKRASLNNIYFKQHFIKAGNFLKKEAG
nr:C40 family peptidase [uncultured Desulfobacter sp.]